MKRHAIAGTTLAAVLIVGLTPVAAAANTAGPGPVALATTGADGAEDVLDGERKLALPGVPDDPGSSGPLDAVDEGVSLSADDSVSNFEVLDDIVIIGDKEVCCSASTLTQSCDICCTDGSDHDEFYGCKCEASLTHCECECLD